MDGSDNPMVSGLTRATPENQQERLDSRPESSETIRQPSFDAQKRKRWSGPYGDVGRPTEMIGPPRGSRAPQWLSSNRSSEIPCRVSSDLHEWRNDLGTVSTRDSAKLQYE